MNGTEEINREHLEERIEQYMPFLIRTVSRFTGRYVSVQHDETFDLALEAFAEAVDRYDPQRGRFLSFAQLVIESRLKNYVKRQNRQVAALSLEAMQESGQEIQDPQYDSERVAFLEEVQDYQEELLRFGLTLEILAGKAPKHRDTRRTGIRIAKQTSEDEDTVREVYRKKKLPVRRVARLSKVTEKIVKTSKYFILATLIVFVKRYPSLLYWIKEAGQ